MNLRMATLASALLFGIDADADILFTSLDPAMPELPQTIHFDCTKQPERERKTLTVLERTLIIPRHFSQSKTDENWIEWNAQIGSGEGSEIFPYVTISFGKYGSEIRLFDDWASVSTPPYNHLGVEIRYKTADPSKDFDRYEVIFFRDGYFLKSISIVPIDWVSLLGCFE